MSTFPAQSASKSELPSCRCLCVWGWIRGFDQCICFLLCHIHNWQVQPAGYSRRKSSVPGMQNHRFLRFSSLCTLHSYPSFPICSKLICGLQLCVFLFMLLIIIQCFLHPEEVQFIPFPLLCNPSCCLVLSHWFLPAPQQSNGNTIRCIWHPFKAPAKGPRGSADSLVQQLNGELYCTTMCSVWHVLCFAAGTILQPVRS